jgi:mannose-6-phosphate isomerase-like protein (cupin superfamily)
MSTPPIRRRREDRDAVAPDGSDIRLLIGKGEGATQASLCEVTIDGGLVSRPVAHRTVEEIWYVIEGRGQVWREAPETTEEPLDVRPGDALVIPTGWQFQFKASESGPLRFLCYTAPPWPGPDEALRVVRGRLGDATADRARTTTERSERYEREHMWLRVLTGVVLGYLAAVSAAALALTAAALVPPAPTESPEGLRAIWVCVAAGTLGSAVSALVSAAERASLGFEFSDGAKWPRKVAKREFGDGRLAPLKDPEDRREMFVARMVPSFLMRPLLGTAMGFLLYLGIFSGYLVAGEQPAPKTNTFFVLAFLAALAGITAKTFLDRLRDMFKALLGGK